MKLKRTKKNKRDVNSNIPARRSLPVDRYYSSSSRQRTNLTETKRSPGKGTVGNSGAPSLKIFNKILQWGSIFSIVAVLLLNVALRDVGVKVQQFEDSESFRSNAEYVESIQSVFNSSVFNKTKFSFNSLAFENKVRETLPEVVKATAVVPIAGTRLQVGLEISEPLMRVQLSNLRQGVIGDNGLLLYESNSTDILSKFSELPLLQIEPTVTSSAGSQLLTSVETELLSLLIAEFDGTGTYRHTLDAITYNIEKREFRVDFNSASYFAKLTSERDPRLQVGALLASLTDLAEKGQLPSQYIDVRVDGRIFVL